MSRSPKTRVAGTATFASKFTGQPGNGSWSLYVVDDAGGDSGSISGGWSLTFSPTAAAGALLISEFRVRGPNGANDEFLTTADFNPPPAPTEKQPNPQPTPIPGTFRLLIYGR